MKLALALALLCALAAAVDPPSQECLSCIYGVPAEPKVGKKNDGKKRKRGGEETAKATKKIQKMNKTKKNFANKRGKCEGEQEL